MQVNTIIQNVNKHLAGEMLRYEDLEPFLDRTIDEINANLNSCFPAISEFMEESATNTTANYNFFPERFIRNVVVPGVAYYYYQADEEGEQVANSFASQYREGLYRMQRDYLINVPLEYQNDNEGYVTFAWDLTNSPGISIKEIVEM